MARPNPSHLAVGYLAKAHGISGEIHVSLLTDHPERVFAPGVVVSLGGAEDDQPDPDLPPLRVVATRPYKGGLLVVFGGIDDRSQAELLCGRYLYRPIDELEPLQEGEVFHHQLVGLEVRTVDDRAVGSVTQIYELMPADLLEVRGEHGVIMVPYRREIVVEVDLEAGRLVIDPPDGLLELGSG